MPLFITQGRFTPEAIKGILAKSETVRRPCASFSPRRQQAPGRLHDLRGLRLHDRVGRTYEGVATSAIVAAAATGVVDLKTTFAMRSADMQQAFARAGPVAAHFNAAHCSGRESTTAFPTMRY